MNELPPVGSITETTNALRIVKQVAARLRPLDAKTREWILSSIALELKYVKEEQES